MEALENLRLVSQEEKFQANIEIFRSLSCLAE